MSANLRRNDVRKLNDVLERLYQPVAVDDFPTRALRAVKVLFPDTTRSVDFVELKTGEVSTTLSEEISDPDHFQAMTRQFVMQNPIPNYLAAGGKGGVLDLADFITRPRLERLDLYEHVMGPIGMGRQLVLTLSPPGHIGAMTINRDWGVRFNDRERFVCEMLRPHLAQAHANSILFTKLRDDQEFVARGWNPARLSQLGLTRREIEVLAWIAEGKRDGEVAIILEIGLRTVHSHVSKILLKLGVETRTAAVRVAHESRLRMRFA